jgi:hypothetical protein
MSHRLLLVACLLTLTAFSSKADVVTDAQLASLAARVTAARIATERWDASAVAHSTHPALVKLAGGKQKLRERAEASMRSLQEQGIQIVSIVTDSPRCLDVPNHLLCFVPKITTVRLGDRIGTDRSFLVAVLDEETAKTWLFVDGTMERNNPGALRKLLPWIPASAVLPDISSETRK